MQAFEILKGGSQIQYGPYTTGGAINMVSTQIPNRFKAELWRALGSFNTKKPMSILEMKEKLPFRIQQPKFDGFKN
jgi:outer membrane receptor for monomeric catechols